MNKYECDERTMQSLENVRNRLRDLVNDDPYVDVATLLYMLNDDIEKMGGKSVELKRHELGSAFFVRKE